MQKGLALLVTMAWVAVPAIALSQRAFTPKDLVMLDRISDPNLSPDGANIAYQLRQTDFAANKGVTSIWLTGPGGTRVLSGPGSTSPRWRGDGKLLYFLSSRTGGSQVWRLDMSGGDAQQVTNAALDVGSFLLSPDGKHLIVSMDMFLDCDSVECTKQRMDARAARKFSGQQFEQLFVRHWDTWSDGTRSQLFVYALDEQGIAQGAPVWVSKGIQGDVPSKPFGDAGEYGITPDGKDLIFTARVAGRTEAWSTNFDLYRRRIDGSGSVQNLTADNPAADTGPAISPDGKTLAYLAARRPAVESDRNAIVLKDLASGSTRELLPTWDRSADSLKWSADGKTLYALADDRGQKRLFAIDVARARVSALTDQGEVSAYDVGRKGIVVALESLGSPTQLYRVATGPRLQQVTHANEDKLAGIAMAGYEQFEFPGWNNESVQGFVMKPSNYQAGKKYPVAFIIHGGPEAAFGNIFHYRWNAQTYAGAGFAVVMIEFHGTPGYGQAFTDSIAGHWGDRPLEDLQKGWAYALAHYPFLDGSRACALGASYGGFMIDWIAGNWSSPWKCLVSHDGIFDTRVMYYSTEELWFEEYEYQGTQFAVPANYERFNPLDHVAEWKVPTLIIQGGRDFRVPFEQGMGAFTALQRRGIPSEFLYFPDENHWVLKPQNSLQWHDAVFGWIKQWTDTP
ncbi:MAG TPA: S9 family peptidase [Steroidobacteraceae bacterium]|jgi:dipeptidyl aminopeptidase/acylaminoacyl peptidase|nr:S9 family peptidase [Steroidobacteraceae bacterium]